MLQSVLCFNAGKGYVNSPWPTFTHETIESQALARTVHRQFFTEDVVRRIYFGNWLRDFSQLNKPSMLKLLGADHTADIVNVLAKISGFKPNDGYVVTNEILGVYRPEEHMDNPERITEDNRPFDSRFRAPVKQVETQIDAQLLSKNYMLNSGHGYVTSADYINKKIHLSVEAMMVGNVHAAFRHFGSGKSIITLFHYYIF